MEQKSDSLFPKEKKNCVNSEKSLEKPQLEILSALSHMKTNKKVALLEHQCAPSVVTVLLPIILYYSYFIIVTYITAYKRP